MTTQTSSKANAATSNAGASAAPTSSVGASAGSGNVVQPGRQEAAALAKPGSARLTSRTASATSCARGLEQRLAGRANQVQRDCRPGSSLGPTTRAPFIEPNRPRRDQPAASHLGTSTGLGGPNFRRPVGQVLTRVTLAAIRLGR